MATTNTIEAANNLIGKALISADGTILVNELGEQILLESEPSIEQLGSTQIPRDSSWVRQTFMTYQGDNIANGVSLSEQDKYNRNFSATMLNYTDSSPGGNTVINPPAQFTPYADIRSPRLIGNANEVTLYTPANHQSMGMGRYYGEAIDSNSQQIHMRFGVASFNSLTQFLTGFYSGDLAAMARGARYTDDFITRWSTAFGNIVGLAVAPLFIIPVAVLMIGSAARFFMNWPSSKFYYLKPSMPVYWTAVNNICNQLAVNSGLSSFVSTAQSEKILKGGDGVNSLQASTVMNIVGQFLPAGLIKSNGTIDVYAVANRTNRAAIEYQKRMAKAFESAGSNASWFDIVRKTVGNNPLGNFRPEHTNIEIYFDRFIKLLSFNKAPSSKQEDGSFERDLKHKGWNEKADNYNPSAAMAPGVGDYFVSNLNDGSDFVSYRVDYTGPVSEHFDSSVAESSLASKVNSMSRSSREARFNLADGNLGGGIGAVTDAVRGVIAGVAEVVQIEGLAALAGSAFMDIPKHWDESTTQMPKANYNITLISPYGNPVSRLFNIWMPLATLLAGALPLATGKQSHTSPFLVELHDRGRCMTRLGIIDSMTITRGTSNLGFDQEGNAMAIEVSFSVLDLSSIMAMPIQQGFNIFNPMQGLFDGDNAFADYLMTLSALKLTDTIYRVPLLKYQINRKAAEMKSFFSASHIGSFLATLPGAELLGAAMRGTDRK